MAVMIPPWAPAAQPRTAVPHKNRAAPKGARIPTATPYFFGSVDCSGVAGVWLVGGLPLVELGFALVGADLSGCTGVACPLLEDELLPLPLTVMRFTNLRLPAYDCAMRSAVCFSLPVATVPESSMAASVTFTFTLLEESIGSLFSLSWIVLCRDALSLPLEEAAAL